MSGNILIKRKGVVMLSTVLVVVAVSIYLTAYTLWTVYDQKHLLVQQKAELAKRLAKAGLERAKAELYLDQNWTDGEINGKNLTDSLGNPIAGPDPNNPDEWYFLYNNVSLEGGTYTVLVDYLQIPRSCIIGCNFYKRRIHLKAIGTVDYIVKVLEEFIWESPIKNLNQSIFYDELGTAVGEVQANDTIAIAPATLQENVNISTTISNFFIEGCYDSNFQTRDCSKYSSCIEGTLNISGTTQVEIRGVIIK